MDGRSKIDTGLIAQPVAPAACTGARGEQELAASLPGALGRQVLQGQCVEEVQAHRGDAEHVNGAREPA